jgi:hypothetical protein
LTIGDFNNDTNLDLAVSNVAESYISVLLGTGNGTFQNQTLYRTVTNPEFILSADLNNDAKQDLAVANSGDNSVSMLFGNGDGTFQNPITYACGSSFSSFLTVGAFKDNNKLDLVATNAYTNSVTILLNQCP